MKKIISILTATALTASLLTGCASSQTAEYVDTTASYAEIAASLSSLSNTTSSQLSLDGDDMFTASDYEIGCLMGDYISITLKDGGSTSSSSAVSIEGDVVTITAEGSYLISGELTNGQIVVDADDSTKLQLVLDGVSISNSSTAPIQVVTADKVFLTTTSGSTNTITATLVEDETAETNVDAAIFSKSDLTLNGEGSLTISATDGNGITSKDDLVITGGNYSITAGKHGLEANDSIRISAGTFDLITQKDGLHCEDDDVEKGYIYITGGSFTIDAQGDGLDSSSQIEICGGSFDILAGGGYENAPATTSSTMGGMMGGMSGMMGGMSGGMSGGMARGMSSTDSAPATATTLASSNSAPSTATSLAGGQMGGQMGGQQMMPGMDGMTGVDEGFTAPDMGEMPTMGEMPGMTDTTYVTEDDTASTKGIKSSGYILISGGNFTINSADDAIHANVGVSITEGTFVIQTGDDGIHADCDTFIAGGTIVILTCYEGLEGERVEVAGGDISIKSNDDGINAARSDTYSGEVDILISGGSLFIDCDYEGDGLDSNGDILMTGGSVIIYGTTTTTDTTLDYGSTSAISGGTFVATGSAGQTLQNFGENSSQGSILVQLSAFTTGDVVLTDSNGNVLVETTPTKSYQAVIISSPDILVGETYTLVAGEYTETIVMESLIYGEGNEHSMAGGGSMQGGMSMGGGMGGGMGGR